jgi:hypothetical protein
MSISIFGLFSVKFDRLLVAIIPQQVVGLGAGGVSPNTVPLRL